jgi:hypothetical protein
VAFAQRPWKKSESNFLVISAVGTLLLLFSKAEASSKAREERCKTASVLAYLFAQQQLSHLGKPDHKLCFAVDVFAGKARRTPSMYKTKLTLSVPGTVVGPTTITGGTIETSCDDNCVLNSSNIIAWSFTGVTGSTPANTISSASSGAVINEVGDLVLIAESTGIVFSLTASSTSLLEFCGGTTGAPGTCTSQSDFSLFDNTSNNTGTGNIGWAFHGDGNFSASLDRGDQITFGAIEAATPLPAALPLFATGLGAMGLLGWRRKRKNTAAIAA